MQKTFREPHPLKNTYNETKGDFASQMTLLIMTPGLVTEPARVLVNVTVGGKNKVGSRQEVIRPKDVNRGDGETHHFKTGQNISRENGN